MKQSVWHSYKNSCDLGDRGYNYVLRKFLPLPTQGHREQKVSVSPWGNTKFCYALENCQKSSLMTTFLEIVLWKWLYINLHTHTHWYFHSLYHVCLDNPSKVFCSVVNTSQYFCNLEAKRQTDLLSLCQTWWNTWNGKRNKKHTDRCVSLFHMSITGVHIFTLCY